jgi:type III pantothenate kinase
VFCVVDVGNTHTVVGVYDSAVTQPTSSADGLIATWRFATTTHRTADEIAVTLRNLLLAANYGFDDIQALIVSSVVPKASNALRQLAGIYLPKAELFVLKADTVASGLLDVEVPREVGADRIANTLAVVDLYTPPAIVVDFGTATTFDVVSEAGTFVGGLILPGVEISLDALFQRAAALANTELVAPPRVVGRNTVHNIQSGALFGFAAQIDGVCERIFAEIGTCQVIATGGLAGLIAPHATRVNTVDEYLTLHGARVAYFASL